MNKNLKKHFKYIILLVILFIPFIYSFFYLKAYWNPYGKGNIDNLPVAVVNEDEGELGTDLIQGIKDSKKLKLSLVSSKEATNGLYNGDYYAMITIPKDFTENMNSVDTNNKKHAMITYSPNQKSNYLASQIINTVILNVEKNMDNEINSKIVSGLSNNINEVPNSLDEINDGFNKLNNGTSELLEGSNKIVSGSNSLATNYSKFNQGLNDIQSGSNDLNNGIESLNVGLTLLQSRLANTDLSGLNTLQSSVAYLNTSESTFNEGLQAYNSLVTFALTYPEYLNVDMNTLHSINSTIPEGNITLKNYILENSTTLNTTSTALALGINSLNDNVNGTDSGINILKTNMQQLQQGVNDLKNGSDDLKAGSNKLNNGINTINESSKQILNGINTMNSANNKLNNGIITLDNSVFDAKTNLLNKTNETKSNLQKLKDIEDYSKEPLKIETKEVNKMKSYGLAFSPLFICVGLWVGCLMLFMVLYYDKEERFGVFGINDKRHILKTFAYHGMITISSIILALTLKLFLDFNITNIGLYYLSFILIGNVFMAIIEFLIINFKDIGKFIALILLILQLTSSAGTFPIETVTKGFRFLNPYLPMTYAMRLLKECIITLEGKTQSMIVLIIIFIVFTTFNLIRDIINQKKGA